MYLSEQIYQLEKQQIFGKAWCYAGHISQLQGEGSHFRVEIAEWSLVIVQERSGLRGFFNVCPHEVESVENFDWNSHSLTPIQVDIWEAFIFVNLDLNAPPLKTQLGGLPERFKNYRFSEWARVHSVDYYTDTNWKLYVENNVESYHEFSVHASIAKYYKGTTAEAKHSYYLQYATFPPDDDYYAMPPELIFSGLGEVEKAGKSTVSLFPNFAWIIRPWIAIIYLIDPLNRSRTRIRWDWLVPNTEAAKSPQNLEPLIQFFDTIQQEDLRLLPAIQKRLASFGYRPGRLSPTREMGTHLFQELVMKHLTHSPD